MFIENATTSLRREVMRLVASLFMTNRFIEDIDKLPIRIISKADHPFRCCIYRDREIIKQRAIVVLGFSLEDELAIDEQLLSDYARRALLRPAPEFPILTFIDEACKACVRANYIVTNVCRNCVARPCMTNCPKDAISKIGEQAVIDPERCINCGICLKVCPFHAIVFVPVPCEEACPVGAISKNAQGKEEIDYAKCIFCGKCSRACPFGAVMDKSQIVDVLQQIKQGRAVVAMIAPSIVGQFDGTLPQIAAALKTLGFTQVVEVALGADQTAEVEAAEFEARLQRGDHVMGTSCCPAYVEAVKKHAPAFERYVSHAKTPMIYTAELVQQMYPEAVRVFIGPCIAKKHEGLSQPVIHYVLTYEELESLFAAKGLPLTADAPATPLDAPPATAIGRSFPVHQGVVNAIIQQAQGRVEVKPVFINGFTRQNVKLLHAYAKKCPGNLLEVMSCAGGCVAGPGVIMDPQTAARHVAEFLKAE